MGEKIQNGIQWAVVLSAVAVALQQLAEGGVLTPKQSVIALAVTTIISAFLPKIRGRKKGLLR